MEVGGIRISHMSGMDREMVLALTATKKARKPYRVLPLVVEAPKDQASLVAESLAGKFAAVVTAQDYYTILDAELTAKQMRWLKDKRPDLFTAVDTARAAASERMADAPVTEAPAAAADNEVPV
jgi:hypothetical protein